MKNESTLFVDILSTIFLIILFIGNFLGLLYILEGNIAFSILGSIILTICYFFAIQLLVKNKEVMYKNKFAHPTTFFWLFYIGLGFLSAGLLIHFINVEFNAKNDIQRSANQKIEVVNQTVEAYKNQASIALEDYESMLKSKLNSYKNSGNADLKKELTKEPFSLNENILRNRGNLNVNEIANAHLATHHATIENNIKNIDSVISMNNTQYKNVFDSWKRLSLMQTYNNLNDYVEASTSIINDRIKKLPVNNQPVVVKYNKNNLPLNSPIELSKLFTPNYLLPIAIILILHLFLLLPFYMKRVKKYNTNIDRNHGVQQSNSNNNGNPSRAGTIEL